MDNKGNKYIIIAIAIIIGFWMLIGIGSDDNNSNISLFSKDTFRIIASTSTTAMDKELIEFGKKNNMNITIDHYGDLEIVDILNDKSKSYDAVWISNSIWLYMLDNSYLTTDSKSIVIDPVVMGISMSKAKELGFVGKDIHNKDLLNVIKDGKLKYVMASVTKTNTGATSYLNFLNSLAGSPEVLTDEMLNNDELKNNLKDFFKGVERVSGDEDYLIDMYKNGDYNAMINYESSLIKLNQELVKNKKEPLYLVYPVDGVAINDMPFAYINNDTNDELTKDRFKLIQSYLRSDEVIKKMENLGYRSWYGGTNDNVNKKIFNPDWGIDTSKYLKDMKYPSKNVITKAINLYIESLRKPTHVVFCLDVSGSMSGQGLKELQESMNYILNKEEASKEQLQFSDTDKISIITFNNNIASTFATRQATETNYFITEINKLHANGGTNIYAPSIKALQILNEESNNDFTKTIILMTDGQSNSGSFYQLKSYYDKNKLSIPIYSITFGDSDEQQLREIANLTNAKVFNGKNGLLKAFREVRSYN